MLLTAKGALPLIHLFDQFVCGTVFSNYKIKSPTRPRKINQKIVAIVERAEIETAMLEEVVAGVVD